MVRKLLQLKFGALDARDQQRIDGADAATLERWGEAVLHAVSVADVLRN